MFLMNYDYMFKLALAGDARVGKSALLNCYVNNSFDTAYCSTIGIDFKVKTIKSDGKLVKLQIWDISGGGPELEYIKSITPSYYRNPNCVIIAFDLSNIDSFNNLPNRINEIKKYVKNSTLLYIVGTKSDLHRAVPEHMIEPYRKEYCYVETSAKQNINIEQLFTILTTKLISDFVPKPIIRKNKN
jgi:small GTP-binding protein